MEDNMESVEIYYVPIGTETYVPITTSNIESMATHIGSLGVESKEIRYILKTVESSKNGTFDSEYVRVKLKLSQNRSFYIDNVGGVSTGTQEKQLDAKALARLAKMINKKVIKR